MMMTFKTEEERLRKIKAITTFANVFGGSFQKLSDNDIDFKVFDKDNNLIAYAEVVTRLRSMRMAYPLPIEVRRLLKLTDKRFNPVIIWCCEDGIIYTKVEDGINGSLKFGGKKPLGLPSDDELTIYLDKNKTFKYVRFI